MDFTIPSSSTQRLKYVRLQCTAESGMEYSGLMTFKNFSSGRFISHGVENRRLSQVASSIRYRPVLHLMCAG